MNYMYPDHLDELNRQSIQRDMAFILKEEMIKPKSDFAYLLNVLGNWMIAIGEKLRKRSLVSAQINTLGFRPDGSKIFKA